MIPFIEDLDGGTRVPEISLIPRPFLSCGVSVSFKALSHSAMFRATYLATPLPDKSHETLHSVTYLAAAENYFLQRFQACIISLLCAVTRARCCSGNLDISLGISTFGTFSGKHACQGHYKTNKTRDIETFSGMYPKNSSREDDPNFRGDLIWG